MRRGGEARIDDRRAGQPLDDVADRLVPAGDLGTPREVVLAPADLRGHVRRVAHQPGPRVHQVGIDIGELGLGAAVGPEDRRGDRALPPR